jgi:hypothetical protein
VKFKKLIQYVVVTIIGIILLNLYASNYFYMREAAEMAMIDRIIRLQLFAALYCFLFGLLLKWRPIERLITKKTSRG